ncbi:MAG: ABC transporter permease [Acidiferrobacterales bacterium]
MDVGVWQWRLASLLIAALVATPIVIVFSAWGGPVSEVWLHLAKTMLPDLLRNTLVMIIGVGSGVFVLGVGLAWLTTMCEFPGRRMFEWTLMLPLAIPAYVLAFVAIGLLDFSGPVQGWLRSLYGPDVWFPNVRSAGGVILVMTLAFYPYVYMLARAAFMGQGRNVLDTGRVLGLNSWASFYRISLPMARPAIAAGVALALMETLADFGAVSIFNFDTFTTAIYKSWFGFFDLAAAAQMASLLLLFVGVALFAEKRMRGRARYDVTGKLAREIRYKLSGWRAISAFSFAAIVMLLAFVIPVLQLLVWVVEVAAEDLDARYVRFIFSTVFLGAIAAGLTVFFAVLLAYTYRLSPERFTRAAIRFSTLGYALPGSVLAVGIMLSFVWLDNQIMSTASALFGISVTQIFTGTLIALLLAYVVRFIAVAYGPVDSAFERIKPSLLQAARSLGASNWQILWRISIPMLRAGTFSAALLVFVEVMKEMPATLLLRPFGWDTLATRIFEMTAEGEWERAALPALSLVVAGLIPVAMLVRRSITKWS